MAMRVTRAAALATVQDLGRPGAQHLAIVPGGAMDPASHRIANALVGNRGDTATLEIALSGPEIVFEEAVLFALHGARFDASLDGAPVPGSRPVLVPAGSRLRIGRAAAGCFGYLAVSGGIDVPAVLGSRSTYLPGGFGGLKGRLVVTGSLLPVAADAAVRAQVRYARLTRARAGIEIGRARSVRWFAPPPMPVVDRELAVLRALDGIHAPLFTGAAREALFTQAWQVATNSNRMGYRLSGPRLDLVRPAEIVSQATCLGTVQVPPGGQPIVLMADHQTTGGYPRIAEVIAADAALLAQIPPGGRLAFRRSTIEEADSAREAARVATDRLIDRILTEFGSEEE